MCKLCSSEGKCEGYGLEYDVLQTDRGSPMIGGTLQPPPFTTGMEVTGLFETWLNCYQTARHHIQEVCYLYFNILSHRHAINNNNNNNNNNNKFESSGYGAYGYLPVNSGL
jgi:hypothetical protein